MKRETKQTEVTITDVEKVDRVELPRELFNQFELYAKVKGLTVAAAIAWALQDWMLSIGEVYLEEDVSIAAPSTMSSKADAS